MNYWIEELLNIEEPVSICKLKINTADRYYKKSTKKLKRSENEMNESGHQGYYREFFRNYK